MRWVKEVLVQVSLNLVACLGFDSSSIPNGAMQTRSFVLKMLGVKDVVEIKLNWLQFGFRFP